MNSIVIEHFDWWLSFQPSPILAYPLLYSRANLRENYSGILGTDERNKRVEWTDSLTIQEWFTPELERVRREGGKWLSGLGEMAFAVHLSWWAKLERQALSFSLESEVYQNPSLAFSKERLFHSSQSKLFLVSPGPSRVQKGRRKSCFSYCKVYA